MHPEPFSKHLDKWLKGSKPKTIGGLLDNFAEKSFAILFVVLMALPATPLPTGIVTHVFEAITIILALELIFGLRRVWLPKKFLKKQLPDSVVKTGIPYTINAIRKLEKYSRPRMSSVLSNHAMISFMGVFVLIFTLFAITAIPFSGLDTLPALGVVFIGLAILLEDIVLFIVGIVLGSVGIGLILTLGTAAFELVKRVFGG